MVYLSDMIDLKQGWLFLMLMALATLLPAQTPAEYEANYAKRIRMEIINGVYIPADLEDAFVELERLSETKGLAEFKSAPEDSIRRRLHFGLGRWILVNWGLEEGSRISHYLRQKGVSNPDDMVEVIILSWHRHLNGRPVKLEEEVAAIEKRRQEEQARRDSLSTKIIMEKRPHKP